MHQSGRLRPYPNIRLGLKATYTVLLRKLVNYDRKKFYRIGPWSKIRQGQPSKSTMRLHHPLNGVTNPKYKLSHFLTANIFLQTEKALAFNRDRCCHLAFCLQLILFHCSGTRFIDLPFCQPTRTIYFE